MGNENTTGSYLVPPQLHGKLNSDGTYSLSALELKSLNDYNYYVAKMLQGGLNLANLNKETNEVFTGMVTFTDLSTGGKTTINGDNITTGTLTGIKIVSNDDGQIVELDNGTIYFKNGTTPLGEISPSPTLGIFMEAASGKWLYLSGKVQVGMYDEVGVDGSVVRLASSGNTSINSSGTTYIGTNASYSGNVDIGQAGGTINLNGDVYINGVPI